MRDTPPSVRVSRGRVLSDSCCRSCSERFWSPWPCRWTPLLPFPSGLEGPWLKKMLWFNRSEAFGKCRQPKMKVLYRRSFFLKFSFENVFDDTLHDVKHPSSGRHRWLSTQYPASLLWWKFRFSLGAVVSLVIKDSSSPDFLQSGDERVALFCVMRCKWPLLDEASRKFFFKKTEFFTYPFVLSLFSCSAVHCDAWKGSCHLSTIKRKETT